MLGLEHVLEVFQAGDNLAAKIAYPDAGRRTWPPTNRLRQMCYRRSSLCAMLALPSRGLRATTSNDELGSALSLVAETQPRPTSYVTFGISSARALPSEWRGPLVCCKSKKPLLAPQAYSAVNLRESLIG